MKKKDEYSDVCKSCVDEMFGEFMDAKFDYQDAMDWFNMELMQLSMDIQDGDDVSVRLQQFKDACEAIAKAANSFVFPESYVDAHGCCEDCEGCADAPDCAADDGENGYEDDSEGNTIN